MIQANIAKKLNFRYDINALRAFAILGVLFFHYKIELIAGGFAGVDVFFVISGYLMSRIIINSINRNDFSFKDYLGKRFKRIVPALVFLVLMLTVVCFFFYFPEDYKLNEKNAAASVLFVSNVLYWFSSSSSYFATSSDTNILLHTWSLSVEWQFYLIYPFVLIVLKKFINNSLHYIYAFIGGTFLIFILSIIFTKINPNASFYLLPTRSWEMLFGGIAFLGEGWIKNVRWKRFIAIVGYLIILCCFVFLKGSMLWPGVYTLLPVGATFLVIIANYNDFKIINHSSIQFIGKISYSLYLWHWPVYVIAQYYGLEMTLASAALLSIVSILLGYLSFKYIENINFSSGKLILATMAIVFICTASLSRFGSNNFLYKDKTLEIANYEETYKKVIYKQYARDTCHINKFKDFDKNQCLCLEDGKTNILLIGDSHMGQLSLSFREKAINTNIHFLQASASATTPTLNDYQHGDANRRKLMDHVYRDFIPKNYKKIDGVIITGSWSAKQHEVIEDSTILNNIKETITYLKKYHIKAIIIGDTERYKIPYTKVAARDYEHESTNNKFYLDSSAHKIDAYLSKNLGESYIRVINLKSFPKLSRDNIPYMWDTHHATKYGADLIVKKVFSDPIALDLLKL